MGFDKPHDHREPCLFYLESGPPPPPSNPVASGARAMRVVHQDERGGALAYLVAWDVNPARLFGRCEAATGIAPFGRLVEQVMGSEPYASAARGFWVVDNGSSHRGQASIDRLEGDWPTRRDVPVDLPAQGADPNDVADPDEVEDRLLAFQRRYEQTAVPFAWRFTRADLDRLLHRLAGEERLLAVA